jgi:diacylglycerol O-acyltransferase
MRTMLAGADAAWLHMDDPTNLMMVTAVLRLDGDLGREALAEALGRRLVERFPRFRQRVVDGPGGPAWEDVEVDLAAQVVEEGVGPGEADLRNAVDRWMSTPLPPERPRWQAHLLRGQPGGAVVLMRIHHCIADGIALARVLIDVTDDTGPVAPPAPTGDPARGAGLERALRAGRHLVEEVAHVAGRPADSARAGAAVGHELAGLLAMAPDPATPLQGPLGVGKRAAWGGPVPLEHVKRTARLRGCTVNDVLGAALAGALRAWLADRGATPAALRVVVPVDLRGAGHPVDTALGNRFSLVFLPLPVDEADRLGRLRRVHDEMARLKRGAEAAVLFGVLQAAGHAPRRLEEVLVGYFGQRATAVMTNVPGPARARSVAGRRIARIDFQVPQAGRLALGVSLLSYAGMVTVGVAADAAVIGDPAPIAAGVVAELDRLARDAGAGPMPGGGRHLRR